MRKLLTALLIVFVSPIFGQQVLYDFESGGIDGWVQVPANQWQVSNVSPLAGAHSLRQLRSDNVASTDFIHTALPLWNIANGNVTWRMLVKHTYNPSGTNCWWVCLMGDSNLAEGNGGNGYVLGVNYGGSDDILKIWKVVNGEKTVLITSPFNWENFIGTAATAALEVKRDASGMFYFRAAKSSDFTSLLEGGSATSTDITTFHKFGIAYKYSSTYHSRLWIDDVSFTYEPLNTNNLTSTVVAPVAQPVAGQIPSLAVDPTAAVEVLRFAICDSASGDNLSTLVKRIAVWNPTTCPWAEIIAGVRLKDTNGDMQIYQTQITNQGITLDVNPQQMAIADGGKKEYSLWIYLKAGHNADGAQLRFEIPATHGFVAELSGSGFADVLQGAVGSNTFTIHVVATHLKFVHQSLSAQVNQNFSATVAATDVNANTSTSFAGQVRLALGTGSGELTSASSLAINATGGLATWNDLRYNKMEPFTITAASAGLQSSTSQQIAVCYDSTSTIDGTVAQPAPGAISSLCVNPEGAVEVLRLRLADAGGDNVPTKVKRIRLVRPSPISTTLSKVVGGVLVRTNGYYVPISEVKILSASIEVLFADNQLVVPDASSLDISILIYLKNSGLTDGDALQLAVEQVHGFTTHPTGSAFTPQLTTAINSNSFTVDVVATALSFASAPKRVGLNERFSVTVAASDLYGNTDINFTGSAGLSLEFGDGTLSFLGGNSGIFIAGKAKVEGIAYSKAGVFRLKAQNEQLGSIVSPNITCGDADATAISIANEVDTVTISSSNINSSCAVEVIRLRIADGGSTDGLPTVPTKISLSTFNPESLSELVKMIGGIGIETSNGSAVPVAFAVRSGRLVLTLPEMEVIVPNGGSLDLMVKLHLNEKYITHGTLFRFYIPASSHGLESSAQGTSFAQMLESSIYGKPCRIEVKATRIGFASYPFALTPSQTAQIRAVATDNGGNVACGYSRNVYLKLHGAGSFSGGGTGITLQNGVVNWDNVSFQSIGSYTLAVSSDSLEGEISQPIIVGYNAQTHINENFEAGLPQWDGMGNWALTASSPIEGNQSLVHAGSAGTTQNFISFNLNPTETGSAMEWCATFRNGNWDPSSSSYFYMVLASSSDSYTADNCQGIAMGINPSAGNDYIALWEFNGNRRFPLITSNFDWNENHEVEVRATLQPNGTISLWYRPKGWIRMVFAGSAKVRNMENRRFGGFVYGYTESRIGQLWIDRVRVNSLGFPPRIEEARALSLSTTRLKFSKPVKAQQAQDANRYRICTLQGDEISVKSASLAADKRNITLTTNKLPTEQLMLYVNGVGDESGNALPDSAIYGFGGSSFGRLVISEIMANPANPVGLPELEYVELHNPTADTVDITGWTMLFKTSRIKLPSAKIAPAAYSVLCSTAGAQYLAVYGHSIGVTSFPSLLNDGMLLKLFDGSGALVSFVNYSKSWYADASKANGGYSLEKIDLTNQAEGSNNWRASVAEAGGTPCAPNSVNAPNADVTPPKMWVIAADKNSIRLTFSEAMDTLATTYTGSYLIDNGVGSPATAEMVSATYDEVMLHIPTSLGDGELYTLSLSSPLTDFAGNQVQKSSYELILPKVPQAGEVVVNEVLFNPYQGGVDFVEVYNNSDKVFNLNDMLLANRDSKGELVQVYPMCDSLHLLKPRSYAAITSDPLLVEQFYTVQNPNALVGVSKIAAFSNDRGCVVVLNNQQQIIDEFVYSEKMHNRLLKNVKGVSLERINPNSSTGDATSWQSAAQAAGFATPTYRNSQYTDEVSAPAGAFSLTPETFSPDGDGHDDFLRISYALPDAGYVANIRVFNASGVEVYRLANNATLGTEGSFVWNGQNALNRPVPMGIYVIHVEYYQLNGVVERQKMVCVVAKK